MVFGGRWHGDIEMCVDMDREHGVVRDRGGGGGGDEESKGGRKGREGERRDGACVKDRRTREGSVKNEGWR